MTIFVVLSIIRSFLIFAAVLFAGQFLFFAATYLIAFIKVYRHRRALRRRADHVE